METTSRAGESTLKERCASGCEERAERLSEPKNIRRPVKRPRHTRSRMAVRNTLCAPIVSCSHALRYHLRYGGGKAGGGYHKKTGVIGIDYLIVAHAYGAYGVIEGYAEYRTYYLYQQSGYAKYSRALYE